MVYTSEIPQNNADIHNDDDVANRQVQDITTNGTAANITEAGEFNREKYL